MNVYPIGNNLTVKWTLRYSDGTVFPLSLYDYDLSYRTSRGVKVATDTTVEDNVLRWMLKADDQVVSGPYSLALKISFAGNKAVDLQYNNAFALTSLSHGNGANVEVCIESNCDMIDLKDAVLQARKAMDVALAAKDIAGSAVNTADGATATANEAKTIANNAKTVAENAATDASRDAAAAQQAAQTASDHITSLQQAIAELPDGQAVTEKVAEHTIELSDLESNLYKQVYSGEALGDFDWLGEVVNIKEGARITNVGDIPVSLYNVKVETSNQYITIEAGKTIVLPFDVVAIRSKSSAGHYELNVFGGVRAEIETDLTELDSKVTAIQPSPKLNHLVVQSDTLSVDETLSIEEAPRYIKIGDEITFFAKVESFGNGITIGKGSNNYSAGYVDITSTECIMRSYASNSYVVSRVNHNLTISDYIKVVIRITNEPCWKIIVQTLQGTFNHEFSIEANAGMPRVTSNGAVLSNVSLTYFNPLLWDKVWAFGDSYFGISSQVREMHWLKEWGYLNFMITGFPGAGSSEMYDEIERCLNMAKPEYIIWCLGMNDNSTLNDWISLVNKVISLCETNGIRPILCTIPNVRNNTTYKNKNEISDWVKNSGHRYIDVQKAVGANKDGKWYGNGTEYDYQSSDNVHPSEFGAKAIATQFIIDVPEIVA